MTFQASWPASPAAHESVALDEVTLLAEKFVGLMQVGRVVKPFVMLHTLNPSSAQLART